MSDTHSVNINSIYCVTTLSIHVWAYTVRSLILVSNNFPTYFAVGDIVCGEHDRHTAAAIWSATQPMEKIGIAVQVVCAYLALLVLTYHLLGTTTSVTVDQKLRRYIYLSRQPSLGWSNCCSFNNPPWFCAELDQSTSDDIELRQCGNENTGNEDVPIEHIELYVQ